MPNHVEVIVPPTPGQALRIKAEYSRDWELWCFFQSDLHWDAPEWLRKLYHKHAKLAKERNALIFDFGDLFDAMGGRFDSRATKDTIRPEHKRGAYFDELVKDAAREFEPYADNWVYMGEGNHESKVRKLAETDLSERLREKLSAGRKVPIFRAGYTGWIQFTFTHKGGGHDVQKIVRGHHGYGGGGEVTKGVIQDHRIAAATEGYDLFVSGHVHEQYMLRHMVERCNPFTGKPEIRPRQHVRLASYKLDWRPDGAATWHTQRGGKAKPIGGAFVRFYCPEFGKVDFEVSYPYVNYDELETAA